MTKKPPPKKAATTTTTKKPPAKKRSPATTSKALTTTSKAPAKKAPAENVSAKKVSAKKVSAKKALAKTVSAKKALAKTVSPTESPTADREMRGADWRLEILNRMRTLILEADPAMVEERKWKKPSNGMTGIPVWSRDGMVCTGEMYTKAVKLTFAHGASVPDPTGLFNASLEGNMRRAIDIPEGGKVDAAAFKALIKAAVARNQG